MLALQIYIIYIIDAFFIWNPVSTVRKVSFFLVILWKKFSINHLWIRVAPDGHESENFSPITCVRKAFVNSLELIPILKLGTNLRETAGWILIFTVSLFYTGLSICRSIGVSICWCSGMPICIYYPFVNITPYNAYTSA